MKLSGRCPRRLLRPQTLAHYFTLVVASLSLLAAGSLSTARADDAALNTIRKLAKEGVKCPVYVAQVVKLVKAFPKDAESIIAEAVKDEPPCACEVVQQGIKATTPEGGTPDPKVVASIVAAIVENIQATNPDMVEQLVSCALEVAPDAGPAILNALAGLANGPGGSHQHGQGGPGPAPGTGGNPGISPHPTPKPPPTPPGPVTGVKP